MILDEIFPTPIWIFDLEFDLGSIEYWCRRKKEEDTGRDVSNIGGWQSNDIEEFDGTPLEPFIEWVEHEVTHLADDLGCHGDYPKMDNLWININPKGGFNQPHVHPVSRFSGVFYIKAQENSGDLCFTRDDNDYALGSICPDNTRYSSAQWLYKPKMNRAILFPSWVKHQVLPNESEEDRISLAFNLR